jgi:hypothetical protein
MVLEIGRVPRQPAARLRRFRPLDTANSVRAIRRSSRVCRWSGTTGRRRRRDDQGPGPSARTSRPSREPRAQPCQHRPGGLPRKTHTWQRKSTNRRSKRFRSFTSRALNRICQVEELVASRTSDPVSRPETQLGRRASFQADRPSARDTRARKLPARRTGNARSSLRSRAGENGPDRIRTCDLGIKSPRGTVATGG